MNIFKVTVEKDSDDTLNIFIIEYEVISGLYAPRTACKPLAEYIIGNKVITKVSDFNVNHCIFLDTKYINSEETFENYYGLNDSLFSFSLIVQELDYLNIKFRVEQAFSKIEQDFLKLKSKFKGYNPIFESI